MLEFVFLHKILLEERKAASMLHDPDDADYDDQGWHKCAFSYISECGPSKHYASTDMCVPVVQCNKTTQRHLQNLHVAYRA
jgi:hypothetical protein